MPFSAHKTARFAWVYFKLTRLFYPHPIEVLRSRSSSSPLPRERDLQAIRNGRIQMGEGNEENNCDNLKYTQLAYRTKAPSYQPQASVLEKEKAPVFTEAFSSLGKGKILIPLQIRANRCCLRFFMGFFLFSCLVK